MSAAPGALRVVAFADPDGRVWGSALDAGEAAIVFGAAGATGAAAGRAAVAFDTREDQWLLRGEGFELSVEPLTGAGRGDGPAAGDDAEKPRGESGEPGGGAAAQTGEELCRVCGTVTAGDEPVEVDCPGARTEVAVAVQELESLRGLWGWFEERHSIALLALRPRGRGGHEKDSLEATVFDAGAAIDVDEPRLSTTYTGQGLPSRANLELWISEGEDQYPRRAAAEAIGAGAAVSAPGLELRVSPMRCHSRGQDGSGVYLLARF